MALTFHVVDHFFVGRSTAEPRHGPLLPFVVAVVDRLIGEL